VTLGAVFCKTEAQDGVEKKVPRLASRETRGWLRDSATSRASAGYFFASLTGATGILASSSSRFGAVPCS
jgi:hypothetical protein